MRSLACGVALTVALGLLFKAAASAGSKVGAARFLPL
jgi:hypothetical protein